MSVMKTYAAHCRCQHIGHETAKAHIMASPQIAQAGRRLTPTLTTLSILLPAASRMAFRLRQHWAVFSAMEPSIRLPWVSAGIWPAHQTWPAALMSWLYGPAAVGGKEEGLVSTRVGGRLERIGGLRWNVS